MVLEQDQSVFANPGGIYHEFLSILFLGIYGGRMCQLDRVKLQIQ